MRYDEEGFLYPSIDSDACIECGKCAKSCPALHPVYDKSAEPACRAAYTDEPVRMKSSSGGIFSLLADEVLARGGGVCGAAFDDRMHLGQKFAYTVEDLEPLRASKYLQSDPGLTYREAKRLLESGSPVLYVGCPCQIAGLNCFLGRPYDNLLTVDLLCHGGPSPVAFRKYLDEVHGDREVTSVGFREKDYFGWSTEMTVRYADGGVYRRRRSEDFFYRSFLPCLSVRPHCQACAYSRLPRQGDITLGDFWGVSRYDEALTDGNGTSIVSLNSEKGRRAYEALRRRLAVDGDLERDYVLTHGQPYGRPFRNNPLRTRFLRMLRDVSFEKALECCEKNEFDFALVGMNADSWGSVLRTYALYRAATGAGYSVLVVRRPKERDDKVTPRRYRMAKFANRCFPVVSTHDSLSGYRKINETSHGFFTAEPVSSFPRDFCMYPTGVLEFQQACGSDAINPLLLLGAEDYLRLARSAPARDASATVAFAGGHASERARRAAEDLCATQGMRLVDLSDDVDIEEWVARIAHCSAVIASEDDAAYVASVLGKPVVVFGAAMSVAEELVRLGVNAVIWEEGASLSGVLERARSPYDTCRMAQASAKTRARLTEELSRYRNESLFRPAPPKRSEALLRSLRKKAGRVKRAVLARLR